MTAKLYEDKTIESVDVKYYNDKYVFVLIKREDNEEFLLIKQLDELFVKD